MIRPRLSPHLTSALEDHQQPIPAPDRAHQILPQPNFLQ